jgi:hypothetical protein
MDIVQEEKFVFTPLYAITQQSTDGADPLQAERERQMRRYFIKPSILPIIIRLLMGGQSLVDLI